MLGLTGSHRTGKTTLAQEFSKRKGMPLVRTSASGVFADMGLDPKVDYPLEVRLDVQQRILEAFEKQYRTVPGGVFVTDRTPIDMMAYTLADVQRSNVPDDQMGRIESYLKDCVEVSNTFFSILMVVQPGIALKDEPGKAPANVPYVEHINHLVMGIVVSEAVESAHYYIPRSMTGLGRRIECMEFAIKRTQEKFEAHKQRLAEVGSPMVFH